MLTKKYFLPIFLALALICSSWQTIENWELQSEKEGIQVFSRQGKNGLPELKVNTQIKADVSTILATLQDPSKFPEWMFACLEGKKLKELDDGSYFARTIIDFPFPTSDREVITFVQTELEEDKVIITSISAPDVLPENSKYVRIQEMKNTWVLSQVSEELTQVSYFLNSSPGGNIPSWVTSLLLEKGPMQTISTLKANLEAPYDNLSAVSY